MDFIHSSEGNFLHIFDEECRECEPTLFSLSSRISLSQVWLEPSRRFDCPVDEHWNRNWKSIFHAQISAVKNKMLISLLYHPGHENVNDKRFQFIIRHRQEKIDQIMLLFLDWTVSSKNEMNQIHFAWCQGFALVISRRWQTCFLRHTDQAIRPRMPRTQGIMKQFIWAFWEGIGQERGVKLHSYKRHWETLLVMMCDSLSVE
jgi:hypothetical protein